MTVNGTVAEGFEAVRAGFEQGQSLDRGGAQLCVYHQGRKVVDLWTGEDTVNSRPYTDRTLSPIFSCTKGALATCAMMLVEQGRLDLDAPVTRYWPEFGQGGKEDMRVWHLLSHTAGLPDFGADSGIAAADITNWEKCTAALAAMKPWWEPGTATLYHAVTFGHLVGEVVRRVTGEMPGQFFARSIAQPLGLRMWIGLPESEEIDFAPHFSDDTQDPLEQWEQTAATFDIDPKDATVRAALHAMRYTGDVIAQLSTRTGRAADIPAGNGICDAASLAKMYAAVIGEVDGVRLLKPETVMKARQPLTAGLSGPGPLAKLPPSPVAMGYGYNVVSQDLGILVPGYFGHGGAGGRMGFCHPESGLAFGYVCNNMVSALVDPRWIPWLTPLANIARA